jgi:ribonuclease HII
VIDLTVPEIRAQLQACDAREFAVLERSLVADTRKGVVSALEVARRRIQAEEAEAARLKSLYAFERELASSNTAVIVGLDEVGRGPLAGPLAVGAVVLDPSVHLQGLNDSKQVKSEERTRLAEEIKRTARAWTVVFVKPAEIDRLGMTASLRQAFSQAVQEIEAAGVTPEVVLLDGNPLRFDEREINVVKGDAQCASIAAASIVAKVARDELMDAYALEFPGYGFEHNKGYGSEEHREAILRLGFTPIHRVSFCSFAQQPSLF